MRIFGELWRNDFIYLQHKVEKNLFLSLNNIWTNFEKKITELLNSNSPNILTAVFKAKRVVKKLQINIKMSFEFKLRTIFFPLL